MMSDEEWYHNWYHMVQSRTIISSKLNYLQYAIQNPVSSVEMLFFLFVSIHCPVINMSNKKSSKFLDVSFIFFRVL